MTTDDDVSCWMMLYGDAYWCALMVDDGLSCMMMYADDGAGCMMVDVLNSFIRLAFDIHVECHQTKEQVSSKL